MLREICHPKKKKKEETNKQKRNSKSRNREHPSRMSGGTGKGNKLKPDKRLGFHLSRASVLQLLMLLALWEIASALRLHYLQGMQANYQPHTQQMALPRKSVIDCIRVQENGPISAKVTSFF